MVDRTDDEIREALIENLQKKENQKQAIFHMFGKSWSPQALAAAFRKKKEPITSSFIQMARQTARVNRADPVEMLRQDEAKPT